MRVTTDFWVSALIRRLQSEGGFAAIVRRGSSEAGAIFLVLRMRGGALNLYGPAPQTDYDESRPSERHFTLLVGAGEQGDLDARLEREMRFDPDVWVVELEAEEDELERMVTLATP